MAIHTEISHFSRTGTTTEYLFDDGVLYQTRRLGTQTLEWCWAYIADLRAHGVEVLFLLDRNYTDV